MTLATLDLFTGIGGFALALKPICHMAAYCDNNPGAQALLERRMRQKQLPRAPLLEDVRLVTRNSNLGKIDLITAGFPCQDLALAGPRAGLLKGKRSGLIREVLRLSKTLKPTFLFLENVPAICLDRHFPKLLAQIREQGYDVAYMLHDAASLGAWHRRQRWFLLAARPRGLQSFSAEVPQWQKQLTQRVGKLKAYFKQAEAVSCDVSKKDCRPRQEEYHLLGNAVVPATACVAFQVLLQRLCGAAETDAAPSIVERAAALDVQRGAGLLWRCRTGQLTWFQEDRHKYADLRCSKAKKDWRLSASFLLPLKRQTRRQLPMVERWRTTCAPTLFTAALHGTPHTTVTKRTKFIFSNFAFSAMMPKNVRESPNFTHHRISRRFACQFMGFPAKWLD
jgi:DNA (cytosine-5)-methyltransferase 1